MKKAAAVFAMALSASVAAESDRDTTCQAISGHAERIMQIRQHGGNLPDAMKSAMGSELLEEMVMEAYNKPNYQTERHIERTVNEFANRWARICYQAL